MTAPLITVSATARRRVPPDSFVLTLTVSGQGMGPADATEQLGARYAELERVVAGLPASVQVHRGVVGTWGEGERRRWHADRAMTLIGSEVDSAGPVVSAVAGLPGINLHGPMWELSEDNPVYGELQADAVQAARLRAERYAAEVGATLGRLIEIRDPGTHSGPDPHRAAPAAAVVAASSFAAMEFDPSELTASASVQATWAANMPS
jgi:uncharacterized protein YggE